MNLDLDLAHALIVEHQDRTGHRPYELERWNFCDVCLHLMPLAKRVVAENNMKQEVKP